LSDFVIKEGVLQKYIGTSEEVSVPVDITTIGVNAFESTEKLTKVALHDKLKEIESFAFFGQANLVAINIPPSLTYIGDHAFAFCSGLKHFTFPTNISKISDGTLTECSQLVKVHISESVTQIGAWAFCGCNLLKDIILPDGIYEMQFMAFSGSGIENIELPASLLVIDRCLFADCQNLISVRIPEKVKYICDNAFLRCSKLQYVTFEGELTEIHKNAFAGCESLIIRANANSFAIEYAKTHGINFEIIEQFRHELSFVQIAFFPQMFLS